MKNHSPKEGIEKEQQNSCCNNLEKALNHNEQSDIDGNEL